VIVMTYNIGSDIIQSINYSNEYELMKNKVMEEVHQYFKPEFINRIDESVVFHSLEANQIEKIAAIQINSLAERLKEKDITLVISAEALKYIGQIGFDHLFGARPLKRVIQQEIENPLAQALLADEINQNGSVKIDIVNDQLSFTIH
jgi:ATP-dependent Clp protease ATP-binding subunit ClpB